MNPRGNFTRRYGTVFDLDESCDTLLWLLLEIAFQGILISHGMSYLVSQSLSTALLREYGTYLVSSDITTFVLEGALSLVGLRSTYQATSH